MAKMGTGVPGAAVVAVWTVYAAAAAVFYYLDVPPSAIVIGACGLLAGVAALLGSAYWRHAAVLASSIHLVLYAIRVGRMVAMTGGLEVSSLLPALAFYYGSSWRVTIGLFQERGPAGGVAHGFIEYAMPLLSLALIALVLASRRDGRRAG